MAKAPLFKHRFPTRFSERTSAGAGWRRLGARRLQGLLETASLAAKFGQHCEGSATVGHGFPVEKKNLFHVPFGSRNGITSYIFLVDISNRNYRDIYIYTLWLSNIAMEAMAHRNRWFTCLKNGGSFPHNQMVDIFGNRNHRFRSPRCWIHWDCGGRIVREPRFGASIGSDPGLL